LTCHADAPHLPTHDRMNRQSLRRRRELRRIAFEDLSAFTRHKNLGTLVQAAD